jgi:hypothetical protein
MRAQKKANGLVAQAIAGTHVVYLGWDLMAEASQEGLLGFAIQRTDHTENGCFNSENVEFGCASTFLQVGRGSQLFRGG